MYSRSPVIPTSFQGINRQGGKTSFEEKLAMLVIIVFHIDYCVMLLEALFIDNSLDGSHGIELIQRIFLKVLKSSFLLRYRNNIPFF